MLMNDKFRKKSYEQNKRKLKEIINKIMCKNENLV